MACPIVAGTLYPGTLYPGNTPQQRLPGAQVRRLLAALRPAGRASARDPQPAVSAVALTEAVAAGPEGRAAFLEADGAAALLELLDARQPDARPEVRSQP
jgi:hypothetical protein